MIFAGIAFILFMLGLFYMKIAGHFNITDTPVSRSSHHAVTIRGGGIIFPLSILLYFITFGYTYKLFAIGLLMLAVISFADDIRQQPRVIRGIIHLLAVWLLFAQTGFPHSFTWLWFIAIVITSGLLNVYNFMDGINGITSCYSFVVMASLYIINRQLHAFDERLLFCTAIGNAVFFYFNFRTRAKCFAGDVGSICMAYGLLFLTILCVIAASNLLFILFFVVYLMDAGLTILHRLYNKENILLPHRKHLYQYMVNEKKIPHLLVSGIYAVIQFVISAGVLLVWNKAPMLQYLYAVIVVASLVIAYLLYKQKVLKEISAAAAVDVL